MNKLKENIIVNKYRNLTDDEFLNLMLDIKGHSPVIDELCSRLEKAISDEYRIVINDKTTCPVCKAMLRVDFDNGNEMYNLKLGD